MALKMYKFDVRTFEFWPPVLKNHKNLHFNGILLPKVNNISTQKYRGVIFHETKEWYKILRKIDLFFQKWNGIWKVFTRASESLKTGTLIGSFYLKKKMNEVKIAGELCLMKIKNNEKFERELNCQFKIDTRNLENFGPSTPKCQTFVL